MNGRGIQMVTRGAWHPTCVQSCKNIDHDAGVSASFRSDCYPNYFYKKLAKYLAKIFEHSPHIEFPRHIFEHSYSKHSEVEVRVVNMNQYRRSGESLHEYNH